MLPKQERLTGHGEFRRVYATGWSCANRPLVLYVLREQRGRRVGFAVPRRIGGAVERNRVRRRLREAYRLVRDEVPGDWHMVLLARGPCRQMKVADLAEAVRELVGRAAIGQRE